MTLDELIEKAKQADGWRLVGRCLRNKENRCPILAVYHLVKPPGYNPRATNSRFMDAGEELGLRGDLIGQLADAADKHGNWIGSPELRERLLAELIHA